MIRRFIETPSFTKKWIAAGLTDEDLRNLQNRILDDPKIGDAIQGTGGLRKMRISLPYTGRRGGARVIYVDLEVKETIYLLDIYTKNKKDNLTESEKAELKALVGFLEKEV